MCSTAVPLAFRKSAINALRHLHHTSSGLLKAAPHNGGHLTDMTVIGYYDALISLTGGRGGRSVSTVCVQNPSGRGTNIHAHLAILKGHGWETEKRLSI
jgi:hypothetical protein